MHNAENGLTHLKRRAATTLKRFFTHARLAQSLTPGDTDRVADNCVDPGYHTSSTVDIPYIVLGAGLQFSSPSNGRWFGAGCRLVFLTAL